MTPHGQRQIDAAKADGRWDAAYAPMRSIDASSIPDDLREAIRANPRAQKTFETLNKQNLFSLVFRTNAMKTAGRPREEDCRAGCNAGAWAGHRPRSAAAAGAGYIVVSEKSLTVKVASAPLVDTSSTP